MLKFRIGVLILFVLAVILTVLLSGCAISRPVIVEASTTNLITGEFTYTKTMRLTSWAFWPATQTVEKQRGSIGKTWSLGAVGIEQETGGTNVVNALNAIDSILGKVR